MVIDLDGDMNRDNYDNEIAAIVGIADRYGVDHVILGCANQQDVADLNVEGEVNTAQAFGMGDPSELTEISWDDVKPDVKPNFELGNYPNPFNGRTMISFSLPEDGVADVTVYDILGRQVSSVFSGYLPAGEHRYAWPSSDEPAPRSGVYYYRITIDGRSETGKMMFLK